MKIYLKNVLVLKICLLCVFVCFGNASLAAPCLRVGDETFVAEYSSETKTYPPRSGAFSRCAATVNWDGVGFSLRFYDDTVVTNVKNKSWCVLWDNMLSNGFVKISVDAGCVATLMKSISSNYGTPLTINGPGKLKIESGGISLYGGHIGIYDADVEISSPDKSTAISTGLNSIHVESSILSIRGHGKVMQAVNGLSFTSSLVSVLAESSSGSRQCGAIEDGNYQLPGKGIRIDGCAITIIEKDPGAGGIFSRGSLKVKDSCIAIVSDGVSFNSTKFASGNETCKAVFSNTRVLAVSRTDSVINVGMADEDEYIAYLGDGEYVFGSASNKSAIVAGRIGVEMGDVECCSPVAYVCDTYGFDMKGGSLRVVSSNDYQSHARKMLSEAVVKDVISAGSHYSGWTGRQAQVLAEMRQDIESAVGIVGSGWASGLIETRRFCQAGGIIDEGASSSGCYIKYDGDSLTPYWHNPAFCGGSLKTNFKFKYTGIVGDNKYHEIFPTNLLGKVMTRVNYLPYWMHMGEDGKPVQYVMIFKADENDEASEVMVAYPSMVSKLPSVLMHRTGTRFVGWSGPAGKRYDDGMLVFDLAPAGSTVTFTALWQ